MKTKNKCKELFLKLLSDYEMKDCGYLNNSVEIDELIEYFQSFFLDNFQVDKIQKLIKGVYKIGNYVLKIKDYNYPEKIAQLDEMVHVYFRKSYIISDENRYISFAIEIQDYIDGSICDSFEELERIYMSMRKKGFIWTDAKFSNVIKGDNKLYVVDTDFIFKDDEIVDKSLFSKSSLIFEGKYLNNKNI